MTWSHEHRLELDRPQSLDPTISHTRLEKLDDWLADGFDVRYENTRFRTCSRIFRSFAKMGEIASFSFKMPAVRLWSLSKVSRSIKELKAGCGAV